MSDTSIAPQAENMARRMAAILVADPALMFAFYTAASEIVDDFEDFGPQLMGTEDGEYDERTPIGRLREARNAMIEQLDSERPTSD